LEIDDVSGLNRGVLQEVNMKYLIVLKNFTIIIDFTLTPS